MPREIFSTFYIEKVTFDSKKLLCSLHYSFDKKVFFTEEIDFASEGFSPRKEISEKEIDTILFPILIAFGISYYKLNPTQKIIVEYGSLDEAQKNFWRKFYINGLGEFFFKNDINFTNLCHFESTSSKLFEQVSFPLSEKYLVPIGGGKDSIVTTILLEEKGIQEITPFIFGKRDTIKDNFLERYGKSPLLIKRKLSPNLFELNKEGYLNGHVPITGLISFALLFVAYLYDYKHIVFSNERSANVGNTEFYGNIINHQYSKSEEFENDFVAYINEYISKEIHYYSALRKYSELEIAKIFCEKGKKYFDVFSSCNGNFKIIPTQNQNIQKRWCGHCPKCLFVYTIMRPFLTKEETLKIWEHELFEDDSLKPLYLEIIGVNGFKPFECVGEVEEAQLASQLSIDNFKEIPPLLEAFKNHFPNIDTDALKEKYLKK